MNLPAQNLAELGPLNGVQAIPFPCLVCGDDDYGYPLMNLAYNYGASNQNTGRVLSRTDAIQPEHSVDYYYDSLYRLSQAVSANDEWGVAWTFDQWGNRLTQSPQGLATSKVGTQTFGYTNNRLTSNTYDAAGNQTNDGLHNYTFNAENQIMIGDN